MRFIARCLPSAPDTRGTVTPANAPAEQDVTLDWTRLIDLGRWHGMYPLLAHKLLSGSLSEATLAVPDHVTAVLKAHQAEYLYRSLIQTSALVELQREFDRSQLSIVPWKGPSVGLLLYGSARLRDSGDLDFLFRERDLPRVQEILSQLGFFGRSVSSEKEKYEFDRKHEFGFFRSRDQMLLEFHSQILTSRFSAWQDAHTYIDRANLRFPLADMELLLQCPADLLISLCVHAAKHNWDRLKWSCDVALFLRAYGASGASLDWTTFLADLRRTGKDAVVLVGLAIAADVFGLVLPAPVLKALDRTPTITALSRRLSSHLMSGSMEPVPHRLASELVGLLCPSVYDRFVYVLSPIVRLEYEDLYIRRETSFFFFLNYPHRFWRLLRRHGLPRLLSMTALYLRSVR